MEKTYTTPSIDIFYLMENESVLSTSGGPGEDGIIVDSPWGE